VEEEVVGRVSFLRGVADDVVFGVASVAHAGSHVFYML
jgi:hypothetical protein